VEIKINSGERFTSRYALLLATIGMAIGAGNIWRFPRLIGEYGGSFLIPWLLFLFLWSIPLAIFEFSLGRKTRLGIIGSFHKLFGPRYVWMGGFITFCTVAIMFYYSVVTGWAAIYTGKAILGDLQLGDTRQIWSDFTNGFGPLYGMIITIGLTFLIMRNKLSRGLERINRILVPTLFILLIGLAVLALTLPGAGNGVRHLFNIDLDALKNPAIWLEGLSQSAWSTGAGWGLFHTYGAYMNEKDGVVTNALFAGLGNNFASIVAALAIVPTVFALSVDQSQALDLLHQGNQGLAFIAIPSLLREIPGGGLIGLIFFLALFFAAFSSLLSMVELAIKNLKDIGIERKRGIVVVTISIFIFGFPSAINISFLDNQDWVWGLGLIISGIFYVISGLMLARNYDRSNIFDGFDQLRKKMINIVQGDLFVSRAFNFVWIILLPFEFLAMMFWWLGQDVYANPAGLLDIFSRFSTGTVIIQWIVVLIVLWIFNRKIAKHFFNEK